MNNSFRLAWRNARAVPLAALALPLAVGATTALAAAPVGAVSASVQAPTLSLTAHPMGGRVTAGRGTIAQQGNTTTITQSSQELSLDWQSFDIGSRSTVDFLQPSANAIAVNRIGGSEGSVILGRLDANGQVFLINPNGVLFGKGAQVNVGGLVASTMDVSDDSLGGSSVSFAGTGKGKIVNQGTITAAKGGYVALLGQEVSNQGVIHAQLGSVALAGGSAVTLSFYGDRLVNVHVDKSALDALAQNGQLIEAEGGNVWMTASARDSLLASAVNNTGLVSVQGVSTAGGVVRLVASGGNAVDSGNIDASGTKGGSVQALSDQGVSVTGNIDASGTQGGGSIRVGGGYQGGEGLPTAGATYIGPSAYLDGDATRRGNGGSVVIWGSQADDFFGRISARGGAQGGNGGLVETSAHTGLDAQGQVDASAPRGKPGTWLLDPYDVTIQTGGASFSNPYTAASTSTIDPSKIDLALTGGTDVFVFTNTQSSGGANGDITVKSPITASGAGSLYLEAAGSITLEASISGDGTHPLNVNLWADYGGSAAGTAYTRNGLCASGTLCAVKLQSAGITTDGGNVDIETGGQVTTDSPSTINAAAGTLTINAGAGVDAGGPLVVSGVAMLDGGDGAISAVNSANDLAGVVSLSNIDNNDVTVSNGTHTLTLGSVSAGANVTASGGGITLTGNVSSGGAQTYQGAVMLANDVTLTSAGSGAIAFDSSVDGAHALTVATAGLTSFDQSVGALAMLTSLNVVQGGTASSGKVSTTGTQSYSGQLTMSGTATTLTGSAVNLNDGAVGAGSLSIQGSASLGGGAAFSFTSLSVTGATEMSGTVTTTGTQNYAGAVTLATDTVLTSTGSGAGGGITFGSTVSGGSNLEIISRTSAVSFAAPIGGSGPLRSMSVDAGNISIAGNVTTTGTQWYGGALSFGSSSTTLAGTSVTFVTPLSQPSENLTITGGAVLPSAVALASLSVSGSSTLNGNVTTSGSQLYTGTTSISADATLDSTGGSGSVYFGGSVSDGHILTVDVPNGGVTLASGGDFFGLTTQSSTFTADGTLNVGPSPFSVMTTGGPIAPAPGAALIVIGTSAFDAGNQAITLSNPANQFGSTVTLTGGTTTIDSSTPLYLGPLATGNLTATSAGGLDLGSGTVNGSLTATAAGVIYQDGPLTVSGPLTVTENGTTPGAQSIALTAAGNDFAGSVSFQTGAGAQIQDLSLTNAVAGSATLSLPAAIGGNVVFDYPQAALTLPAFSAGGELIVTANGVSQSGAILVTGMSHITAGTNAITLSNAGNDFQGELVLTGGPTTVDNSGALTLDASTAGNLAVNSGGALDFDGGTVTGTLTAAAAGLISQSAPLTVTGAVSLTQDNPVAGGSVQDILLGESGNNLAGGVSVAAGLGSSIQNLSLANGASAPGTLTLPASIGGNLTLNYTRAVLTVPGTNVGGALDVSSVAGIVIDGSVRTGGGQAYHNSVTLGSDGALTSTGGGAIEFDDNVSGGHTLTLDTAGPVTLGSAWPLNGLDSTSGTFSAGTMSIGSAGLSVTTTAGTITQSGQFVVSGASRFNAGGDDITLTNSGNQFTGAVSLTGGNAAVVNAAATVLGAGTIAGALTVDSPYGAISQAGPLSVAGASHFNAGGSAITLSDVGDDFQGAVSLSGGATVIANGGPLMLGVLNTGDLTASARGALNVGGGTVSGALTASGSGLISQSGALSVGAGITVTQENASAGGNGQDITLDNAGNNFAGNITFAAASGAGIENLSLTNDVAGAGNLSLPAAIGGNLSIDYPQAVSLTLPTVSAGGSASIESGGGLTLGSFSAASLVAEAGSDLVIDSGASVTASGMGDALVLVDGQGFINIAGSGALSAPRGAWQIWSQNPANDSLGGLVYGFEQYDAAYGTTAVQGSGNGLLYALAPVLNVSLTGSVSKPYDGTTAATLSEVNFAVSGQEGLDSVEVRGNAVYDTPDAGTGKTVMASGLMFTASQEESGATIPVYGYQLASTSASGTIGVITPVALTITADGAAKTYDGQAFGGGGGVTYAGFVAGEGASVLGGSLSYGGTAQGAVNAGAYTLVPGGLTSNNYAITYVPGTLTVRPAALTITADDAAKTYDGNAYAGGGGVTYAGFVNGERASVLSGSLSYGGTAQGAVNAGAYTLVPGGLTSNDYAITYVPGTLTVGPAALTITADDAAKTYNGQAYAGGAGVTYDGFVHGEGATVLGGSLSYGGTAQGAVNAGGYTLVPGGLTSNDYAITYVSGTLTVSPATLAYVASPSQVDRGSAVPALTGTVLGFVGGDTLASATTGTLTFTTAANTGSADGQYAIVGSGLAAKDGNYVFVQAPGNATALTVVTPPALPLTITSVLAGLHSQGDQVVPQTPRVSSSTNASDDLSAPAIRVVDGGVRLQ